MAVFLEVLPRAPDRGGRGHTSVLRGTEGLSSLVRLSTPNRFSVALSWHSAVFNAVCALVLVLLPSPPYSQQDHVPPTRFHGYWLTALDYVSMASVVIPVIIVALSFFCLLTLTRSPLRNVVPSTESVAFVQDSKREDITLRPFNWVYHSTDRSLSSRELVVHGRRPQSTHDDSIRYPPPRQVR
ncbi:hypothetical protein MRX96_014245 [Rhipicephalus microplus]